MDTDALKARRAELEVKLREVKDEIFIRERAQRPHTTQNNLAVCEGEPFWGIGYRNHIYHNGDWVVRFTNEERRAKLSIRAAEYADKNATHRLFEFTFPVVTLEPSKK